MAAITTISGHVSRALDFVQKTNMWMALAKPFDWNIARLTGKFKGPFDFQSIGRDFEFILDDTYTITVQFANADGVTASAAATAINNEATVVVGSVTTVATVVGNRIRLTSPTALTGSLEVTVKNDAMGFLVGDKITAASSIPSADPTQRRMFEPFAFEKIVTKTLCVADADTPATITGTNQGNTFNTSVANGTNTFSFKVNGSSTISVTFPDSTSTSMSVVVAYINDAADLVSGDYAEVATIDSSVSPPRVKLTSNLEGSSSTLQVIGANTALGIAVQSQIGADGGALKFRDGQFREVANEDAYDEGAMLVYVEAEFPYDEVPVQDWSQVGVITDLTLSNSVPNTRTYANYDEVDDEGILSYTQYRSLSSRSNDSKELIRFTIQF